VPGDPGAHGRFDGRATSRSQQLWLTEHRALSAVAGLLLAGLAWRTAAARL
jgi:hypothetical protein